MGDVLLVSFMHKRRATMVRTTFFFALCLILPAGAACAGPSRSDASAVGAHCDSMASITYGEFMSRLDELQRISKSPAATKADRRAAKRELSAINQCTRALGAKKPQP